MTPLCADLLVLFRRDLQAFRREVALFPDDDALWRATPGFANSAGNLALHVAGNLRHFIGAVLGGTGYERDRDAEFGQRVGSRSSVEAELEAALDVMDAVLPRLTERDLAAPFPVPVAGVQPPTGRFLLHLATHTAFHLGQAGTLRRILTGEGRSAGAMAVSGLAEP
ncbi:MAG TPA: DinB family protein [Holophagaceae bacterium]